MIFNPKKECSTLNNLVSTIHSTNPKFIIQSSTTLSKHNQKSNLKSKTPLNVK